MMKKNRILVFILIIVTLFGAEAFAETPVLNITGTVRQPLSLSVEDINRYQTVTVQLNEIMKDGTYRGVFYYRGVPLRVLLDTASIQKEETAAFSKKTDMAILVKSKDGKEVALSWGEIYYRNSSDIIVATSASPIMPHKSCASCHDLDFYRPYMDQFSRDIGLPKLVVGSDTYADRSIEDIVSIQVIDPGPRKPAVDSGELFSPAFTITGDVKKEITITDLSPYPRAEARVKMVGEGKGFHGITDFSGAPLKAMLDQAGIDYDLTKVFYVSAPDGYYALYSYGEIYLNRDEESVILADTANNEAIQEGGSFFLIATEDLMADRDVKSVEEIEVIRLGK
jgi:DMSO/TMAO reductase YedYZ molybdopterin-dependent catalytic subunit